MKVRRDQDHKNSNRVQKKVKVVEESDDVIKEVILRKCYQRRVVVYDDMHDSNQKSIESFFTDGGRKVMEPFLWAQFCFDQPYRTIRINSNTAVLFKQTSRYSESFCTDISVFDISYDELKDRRRDAWRYQFYYLKTKNCQESEINVFAGTNLNLNVLL